MNNNYYIPQSAPLSNAIHSLWQVDYYPSFRKEQILPKGVIEIIFNFSGSACISAQTGNKQYELSKCFINGFTKTPVNILLPKQQVFFGIRLQPLAAKKLFGIPAMEFSDVVIDATLLDTGISTLWEQLADQGKFDKRVAIFCNWIEKKLFCLQSRESLLNNFLCGTGHHEISVTNLAGTLCYSTRQLSRKIFEITGMNTEEILLYKKYLNAVYLIHNSSFSLTEIAYQSNFSDQSHFIRSFKVFTEMTPGEYKHNKSNLPGHLYENVR